jgi:hypothetical protein
VDSVVGTVVLDSASSMKGIYSADIPSVGSGYLQENFTAVDDLYVSFYLRINSLPTANVRIALISNAGTIVGNIVLRTTGTLRLRNGTTAIGADSASLTAGTLYRVGLRQKRGTGQRDPGRLRGMGCALWGAVCVHDEWAMDNTSRQVSLWGDRLHGARRGLRRHPAGRRGYARALETQVAGKESKPGSHSASRSLFRP